MTGLLHGQTTFKTFASTSISNQILVKLPLGLYNIALINFCETRMNKQMHTHTHTQTKTQHLRLHLLVVNGGRKDIKNLRCACFLHLTYTTYKYRNKRCARNTSDLWAQSRHTHVVEIFQFSDHQLSWQSNSLYICQITSHIFFTNSVNYNVTMLNNQVLMYAHNA